MLDIEMQVGNFACPARRDDGQPEPKGETPPRSRRSVLTGARARGADRLHPTMRSRMWQPGVSGNPTGRSGLYLECRRVAAEASPQAMRRLIELMNAEDERVSYMATTAVLGPGAGAKQGGNPEAQ